MRALLFVLLVGCGAEGSSSASKGLHDLGECGVSWSFEPSHMWMCETPCYARPMNDGSGGCRAHNPDVEEPLNGDWFCRIPFDYEGTRGCCMRFDDERTVRFMVCE